MKSPTYEADVARESELFARLNDAIEEAIGIATDIWDADYAVDYVQGHAGSFRPTLTAGVALQAGNKGLQVFCVHRYSNVICTAVRCVAAGPI